MKTASFYLPEGLPVPVTEADGLSAPFWDGLQQGVVKVQRCNACQTWQWGPEWICHHCHSDDIAWVEIEPKGRIFSWERVWHSVHPALNENVPYLVVLVELPGAGNIRMLGNLLGDPKQEVQIGAAVTGVLEHHPNAPKPHSLLQWKLG